MEKIFSGVTKMNKLIITVIFIVTLLINSYAGASLSGGKTLSIPVGVRSIGAGEAGCGMAGDLSTLSVNPASAADINSFSASAMYSLWLDDIRISSLTAGLPFPNQKIFIGAGATLLSVADDIPLIKQDSWQNPVETGNTFGAQDMVFSLFGAARISKNILTGLDVKLFHSKIEEETATALAVDLGGIYQNILKGLNYGLSLQNLGPGIKYTEKKEKLPLNIKTGLSYLLTGNRTLQTTILFDVNQNMDSPVYCNTGTEFNIMNICFLRAGYKFKQDDSNFRLGGGSQLKIKNSLLMVNYAFSPFTEINNIHSMEIQFRK